MTTVNTPDVGSAAAHLAPSLGATGVPGGAELMTALSVTAKEQLDLVRIAKPIAGPGEVVVRVAYCGICGSDFPRYFEGGVHAFPQIVGHEFAGVVDSVAAGVTSVVRGTRVAVAPLAPCGTCPSCELGRPALCSSYSFIGSRRQGALAEYVSVPADNVVPLPDSVSLRDAALVEPLTVAIHGIDRIDVRPGARVAVFGAGVIGLMTVMALKARGAGQIVVVDLQADKLSLADQLGADVTVLADGTNVDDYFRDHEPVQVCIETAGSSVTQAQAVQYCAKGGDVVFVGTSTRDVVFASRVFEQILRGELNVTGSWMSYSAPFPGAEWLEALAMIESGAVTVAPLVSRVYSLQDGAKPFLDIRASSGALLKVLYRIGADA
jgi:L-iditol 2-dehydrogenase/galactitol-1-phosphate 5-dehydrogenase